MMSEVLIGAVDSWLVSNRGVPRNMLRRRMLVRLGRIGPVDCPGLHMPGRVSMTGLALRFHFLSRPIDGLNLIALPALMNDGIRLAPTGDVSVVEECLTDGQELFELPPEEATELGFELRYRGRRLAMELLFDAGETDYSSALYHMRGNRFRGLFRPPE
ncbi:hypothetical protein R3X27_02500 [Tropicimonas sp. TH_r6]|uniref:hypothetical protein n=1 Tax=Tropicimonas sp. TH_r6 TaxID=3082085 RepID=UPI002954AE03|nr:hypothetical protein [Tropicimonas sp. TH_r6]MDV7141545.1 hypothetical protein [Tropicimonas sp. TH_r6]